MAQATRKAWAERVRRWRASGLTAREFGRRDGHNPATLKWWAWALRRSERRPAERGAFVEVALAAAAAPAGIEVVVREGVRIRVEGGFDAELLRRVVAALEAR
jgi:hypothetical protein